MSSPRPPLLATWMLRRLTRGPHSEALQGDLLEAWRAGRGNAWYWRQVLIAVAAFGITTSLILAIPPSVSVGMRVFMRVALANHEKWRWPLVMNGLTWSPLVMALTIGPIAAVVHGRRHRLRP